MLFNKLPRDDLGTGRWFVSHLCGCSSAGRARPRHGRSHEFEARHPLHFGCVHALRCRATWCWRCGMCATQGRSHVRRDTTSDGMLAFGHSRSGNTHALVAQQAEQPPCKRQAARSIRRRGHHQTCRVRLTGRTPLFQGGNAGSNPARDASQWNPRRAHASRVEIGRNDWAAPEPVTGWLLIGGVAQVPVEQPPCKRQAAGSNPVTSTKLR